MTAYRKPGVSLILFRANIIGPERFDRAFKSYTEWWANKHPKPQDFFNILENITGEDLNWFWKAWFYDTGNIDLSIVNVQRIHDSKKSDKFDGVLYIKRGISNRLSIF